MHTENQKTFLSYEAKVAEYISRTPSELSDIEKAWLNIALADLDSFAHVFEIGSGSGRDASYIKSLGYDVRCSDAKISFVKHLKKIGHDAMMFNILTDELSHQYDLIFANAVLLHFRRDETKSALQKVANSLSHKDRFAFSIKAGHGEEWSTKKVGSPRYFCYWSRKDIESVVIDAGFSKPSVIECAKPEFGENWLYIVGTK